MPSDGLPNTLARLHMVSFVGTPPRASLAHARRQKNFAAIEEGAIQHSLIRDPENEKSCCFKAEETTVSSPEIKRERIPALNGGAYEATE
jgi:hypothetical protein